MNAETKQHIQDELYLAIGALHHARMLLARDLGTRENFVEEVKAAYFKLGNVVAELERDKVPAPSRAEQALLNPTQGA